MLDFVIANDIRNALQSKRRHIVYEIGKYSRTTSKQVTQICKIYFSDYERVFMEKRFC